MVPRAERNFVCSDHVSVCLNNDQNVVSCGVSYFGAHGHGNDVCTPKIISSLKHITSISTFSNHCACLDSDGNVFTFGSNYLGKLGIGDAQIRFTHIPQKVNLPPCIQISCGFDHTICLSESGKVYSFGKNEDGELGLGSNTYEYYSPQVIESLRDVEFIECGGFHVFCKTLNNEIFCWGDNSSGQLGLGNTVSQNTPILCSSLLNEDIVDIKCGHIFTLALTSNGDVFSCGRNDNGQLGRKTEDEYSFLFQQIGTLSEIMRIECGFDHFMCIDIKSDLYVSGHNGYGQLGLSNTYNRYGPMKHPSLSNIIDISKGGYHTFVKTSNNEIFAFGDNACSQLGIKTKDEKLITPIRVFEDNEDIWYSNINKSKQKSARSVINSNVRKCESNEKLETPVSVSSTSKKRIKVTKRESFPAQSEIKSKNCVIH